MVAEVAYGGRADAERAIEAAARAFPAWRAASAYDRAKVLKKTAELMRERADAIARTLTQEQGKPLAEAKAEVLHAADTFEWFAEEGKRAYGRIIPPCERRQAALRDQAPGRRRRHDHALELPGRPAQPQDRAGPGGRLHGREPAGRPDAADPDPDVRVPGRRRAAAGRRQPGDRRRRGRSPMRSSSTRRSARSASPGRPSVGKELIRRSADQVKRLSLELGGHAPLIVFPDADVQQVAQAAVIGKFRNNGQVCIAPSRFYVHEKIAKDFTEAAVELTRNLKIGNGLEAGVQVGPMFEARALDKTAALVEDARTKGGKILTGGGRSSRFDKGYWFEPTVIREVNGSMKIMTEEPFAPVMPLLDFSKLDDVIAAANNTPYGLAAYVFTNDLTVATRMAEGLEAGIIGINDPVPATPQCPFGGMKESGLGRELGIEGLDAYLETKYVSVGLRQA